MNKAEGRPFAVFRLALGWALVGRSAGVVAAQESVSMSASRDFVLGSGALVREARNEACDSWNNLRAFAGKWWLRRQLGDSNTTPPR
jgi:hypothetical protein